VKNKKIFFFGTPSFSANILSAIIEKGIIISGIFTGIDKPKGRGYELQESDVAKVAKKYKINLYKPQNIEEIQSLLDEHTPDLCLVIAYGVIFSEDLVKKYLFVNIHTSLLPKYRGPSPVQTCLLNDDKTTGVTLMKIGKKVDDGDIIAQKIIDIDDKDTSISLFNKLEKLSVELLMEQIPVKDKWKFLPQDITKATYCKKIKKEDGLVELTKENYRYIYNKYRAFYSWPGIYLYSEGKRIKLKKIVLDKEKLIIESLQKEGKKEILYSEFLKANPPLF
jgi:methionyl-tRNA formyltransferase